MHLYYAGRTKIIKLLSCVCVSVSVYTKSMYNSRSSRQQRNIKIILLFSKPYLHLNLTHTSFSNHCGRVRNITVRWQVLINTQSAVACKISNLHVKYFKNFNSSSMQKHLIYFLRLRVDKKHYYTRVPINNGLLRS